MSRVKSGPQRRQKHNKILKEAKGFRGTRSRLIKRAKEAVKRKGEHEFAGRRIRRRDMRTLWISRLNAALEQRGIAYNRFISQLKTKKVEIDRKQLSELAINYPEVFNKVVEFVTK